MTSQPGPPVNLRDAEQEAVQFHENSVGDATAIWRDGLNVYLAGINEISGCKTTRVEQHAQVAALLLGWQASYCAFDLALRGYYPQALNLLRPPVEYWMTYWYLRSFPSEHIRFTDRSKETPSFNDMRQRVEAKVGRTGDTRVRDWIKRLHKFSHVDTENILYMIDQQQGTHYLLGPQQDAWFFRYVVAEATAITAATLEAVDNLRQLMRCQPLPDFQSYATRVEAWQRSQTP